VFHGALVSQNCNSAVSVSRRPFLYRLNLSVRTHNNTAFLRQVGSHLDCLAHVCVSAFDMRTTVVDMRTTAVDIVRGKCENLSLLDRCVRCASFPKRGR
jgi:hypothetical protein